MFEEYKKATELKQKMWKSTQGNQYMEMAGNDNLNSTISPVADASELLVSK